MLNWLSSTKVRVCIYNVTLVYVILYYCSMMVCLYDYLTYLHYISCIIYTSISYTRICTCLSYMLVYISYVGLYTYTIHNYYTPCTSLYLIIILIYIHTPYTPLSYTPYIYAIQVRWCSSPCPRPKQAYPAISGLPRPISLNYTLLIWLVKWKNIA